MIDEFEPDEIPLDVERLIDAAVEAALELGEAGPFLRWMRDNIGLYGRDELQPQLDLLAPSEDLAAPGEVGAALDALSQVLGRKLWNALPLPANHFRPRPLPRPGRNDPCFCGSGKKYKQCCAQLPSFPDLDPGEIWPLIIRHLGEADRRKAIASGRMPPEVLGELAHDYLQEQDAPKKAADLLEPLFAGEGFRGTDDRYDWLLNLLCNVYDRLGYSRKKSSLLQRVIADVPRSPLRSGAWQRLAAMRMDEGDTKGAWDAFGHAQRDAPGAPSLGMLEIQLLLAEQRSDEARQRARFWLGTLTRSADADEDFVGFFEAVAEDPHRAMLDLVTGITAGAGEGFQELVPLLEARPLPLYEAVPLRDWEPEEEEAEDRIQGLAGGLRAMGLAEKEITEALMSLEADIEGIPASYEEVANKGRFAGAERLLRAPKPLRELEREWREVFPLDKPFLVSDESVLDIDPWEPEEEASWVGWLTDHPEAFDSLDVLDDIVTALMDHPQFGTPWFNAEAVRPVLERSAAILEKALAGHDNPVLAWGHLENRPALRNLSRLIGMSLGTGDEDRVGRLAERLLALNPDDNHGVRALVINGYLAEGRNDDALALAERHPDDVLPDLVYGQALALYRMGRLAEAEEALRAAAEALPKVAKMLTAKSPRRPRQDPHGVLFGGDEQAWLYREAMLEQWQATPDALEWLRRARRRKS